MSKCPFGSWDPPLALRARSTRRGPPEASVSTSEVRSGPGRQATDVIRGGSAQRLHPWRAAAPRPPASFWGAPAPLDSPAAGRQTPSPGGLGMLPGVWWAAAPRLGQARRWGSDLRWCWHMDGPTRATDPQAGFLLGFWCSPRKQPMVRTVSGPGYTRPNLGGDFLWFSWDWQWGCKALVLARCLCDSPEKTSGAFGSGGRHPPRGAWGAGAPQKADPQEELYRKQPAITPYNLREDRQIHPTPDLSVDVRPSGAHGGPRKPRERTR
jgi:hypothetical protein